VLVALLVRERGEKCLSNVTLHLVLRIDREGVAHQVVSVARECEMTKDRGALSVGILLVATGCFFLVVQTIGWGRVWPFLILLVGAAFWVPIFIWWDRREQIAGLAVPGTIIVMNGLILLFQSVTGRWSTWSYLWPLELIGIGAGLLALYVLGKRQRGLLRAASIVGGIGVVFFFIFATAFGRLFRFLGPVALIMIGLLAILRGVGQRAN